MAILRPLGVIIGIFVIAVALGLLFHPLVSLLFIVLAKVVEILWRNSAETYRKTYDQERSHLHKRKRSPAERLILTDDGEVLDVVDDEPAISRGAHHG